MEEASGLVLSYKAMMTIVGVMFSGVVSLIVYIWKNHQRLIEKIDGTQHELAGIVKELQIRQEYHAEEISDIKDTIRRSSQFVPK